jgi:molecular chaperone HscA
MLLQIHEPGDSVTSPESLKILPAIGIDLGTTHSVVSIVRDGQVVCLPISQNESVLVPSVVAYNDDQITVGVEAVAQLNHAPDYVVTSVKRLMDAPSEIGRVSVGGQELTAIEVSAHILGYLKQRTEAYLEHEIQQAVITVPAYFSEAARTATRDAAQLAGFEVLRIVNEPTAAALAYGLETGAEGVYAIYDLGGGTFDISLLKLHRGVFQVLATQGDLQLGGDDIDEAILQLWLAQRQAAGLRAPASQEALKPLRLIARQAKEALSSMLEGQWVLDIAGTQSIHTLTQEALAKLAAPFIERTLRICAEVVQRCNQPIKGVVTVGGSTRMPLVRHHVAEFFNVEPYTDIDPDMAVAMGAALQADALTGGRDTLLIDMTPLSLGIETMGGLVERLIERNTPIPVRHKQEFTTFQDGQTAILIHVVQGEREFVKDCQSLGQFELRGIPPMPAGVARVEVIFALDADGLLTVSATEQHTGVHQAIEIKPSYGLTTEDIKRILSDSYMHGRADMAERLLAQGRLEAEQLITIIEKALAQDADLLSEKEVQDIKANEAILLQVMEQPDYQALKSAITHLKILTQPLADRRMMRSLKQL